jgi:RNA polymerase sigma-70 factor (ECF subfamily)
VSRGSEDETRAAMEAEVRRLLDAGDRDAATTLVLRRLGPEIVSLLASIERDADAANDAFSRFAEKLWTSFDRWEARCSARTWSYMLARRAAFDVQRDARRHHRRARPLEDAPEVEKVAAHVRTATLTLLRTETKSKLVELRQRLPDDDQLLLILRIDRHLSWEELARVFLEEREDASAEALKRKSARLRKRFQLVKERLRALAVEHGLVHEERES